MIIFKSFKFRLKTNSIQQAIMRNFAGGCRFVWNKILAAQKERLEAEKSCMNYSTMAAELVNWKQQEETIFLKEVH